MGLTTSFSARASVAALGIVLGSLTLVGTAPAQTLKSIQEPTTPLVLKSRGSFFVGGRSVEQKAGEILLGPDDSVTVDQM